MFHQQENTSPTYAMGAALQTDSSLSSFVTCDVEERQVVERHCHEPMKDVSGDEIALLPVPGRPDIKLSKFEQEAL